MRPALALLCTLTLFAALANSSCCCLCSPGPACADANLPRDDTLSMPLAGQALFVARPVNGVERRFCQMSLSGSYPLTAGANDRFSVVSIGFYGLAGEHSAEEVLAMQCPALLTLPWPARYWNVPRLETSWDGSVLYTLAARVVYEHTLPDGSSKRVYTLARGVFRNIVAAQRSVGVPYVAPPPTAPADQDTITQLTVGGVFQSGSQIALYDVSVDYASMAPATLVEVFSTDLGTPAELWTPASRIWVDPRPSQGHWSGTQIPGPFQPPSSVLLGVRITYGAGVRPDQGRVSFSNPVGTAVAVALQ